ncbi:TetR/AcrR family transcriptional regulator [Paracoccus sp. M683]|uniref:TetR/AcrR family transcriptional regulator n=1 Tax=Paracoccus sp. M683 TaxID=2594268 RepID=UPI00117FDB80|nr:TetR/AcrR family transcriptional regulator [Paracoccus sp. M683]TRW95747.1 TetR/AcrR family transcriptional regulator [Paracoccus sp. M683]
MTKTSREEIIAAAQDMFRRRGYAGLSMAELADAVGLRKASLYSRFAAKEDLAIEALQLTLAQIEGACPTGPDWQADYRASITAIADHLAMHHRCLGLHLLYGTAEADAVRAAALAFFGRLHQVIQAILERHHPPRRAAELAEDALSQLEGATLWLAFSGDEAPMRRAVERVLGAGLANQARTEAELREKIAELEGDVLTLRGALAGQIEAESCFR